MACAGRAPLSAARPAVRACALLAHSTGHNHCCSRVLPPPDTTYPQARPPPVQQGVAEQREAHAPSAGNESSAGSSENAEKGVDSVDGANDTECVGCLEGVQCFVHSSSGEVQVGGAPPAMAMPRGGLLCDAPGLGKTITLLSLLLRTAHAPLTRVEAWNQAEEEAAAFRKAERGWAALVRQQEAHALLKAVRRGEHAEWFMQPVDPVALGIEDYPLIVHNPMDLGTIGRRIASGAYAHSLHAFVDDVRLTFSNAVITICTM